MNLYGTGEGKPSCTNQAQIQAWLIVLRRKVTIAFRKY